MQQIKSWWGTLNDREQKLTLGCSVVLVVGLFFFLVWQPLANTVVTHQQSLHNQLSLNQWAKTSIEQIKASGGVKIAGSGSSLTQVVNQTSRQFNIVISRMNPKGDELQLALENVVFNDLLRWLAHLEQNEGVLIHNLDISQNNEPGLVSVGRLVVEKQ